MVHCDGGPTGLRQSVYPLLYLEHQHTYRGCHVLYGMPPRSHFSDEGIIPPHAGMLPEDSAPLSVPSE